MLKEKHIAIVRAALTFWDEEIGANESMYKHYLHSSDQGIEISPADIMELRMYFNEVQIQFALVDDESGVFVSTSPVRSHSELDHSIDSAHVVSVWIPSGDAVRRD